MSCSMVADGIEFQRHAPAMMRENVGPCGWMGRCCIDVKIEMADRIAYFLSVIKFAVPFGENGWKSRFFEGGPAQIAEDDAGVAQLVEHHLAKVRVASSSLVSRSIKSVRFSLHFFCLVLDLGRSSGSYPGGGIGRHAGLKILWLVIAVRVQLPSGVHK